MPNLKERSEYESPQVTKTRLATKVYGGDAPSEADVIKSANAKGGKRHELKGQMMADENVLPNSGGESVDKTGIHNNGYLAKKGTPFGVNAFFNTLPPGMDIEDQEIGDIREQPMHDLVDHTGFDGWK